MKSKLYYFLLFLLFVGCQNETNLTFEPFVLAYETCDDCPEVSIAIPKASGLTKISKTINTALEEELISLLSFDEEIEVAAGERKLTAQYRMKIPLL